MLASCDCKTKSCDDIYLLLLGLGGDITTVADQLLSRGDRSHQHIISKVLLGGVHKLSQLLSQQIRGLSVGGGRVLVGIAQSSHGQTDQDQAGSGAGLAALQLLGQGIDGGQLVQEGLVLRIDIGLQSGCAQLLGDGLDLPEGLRDDEDLEEIANVSVKVEV